METSFSSPPNIGGRFTVPQRLDLKWAAVDLDGTIARGIWTPEDPTSAIGELLPGVREKMMELTVNDFNIVVHTARAWSDYEVIESYLNHNELPWKAIVCGKLLAAVYVDDRARYSEDRTWLPQEFSPQPVPEKKPESNPQKISGYILQGRRYDYQVRNAIGEISGYESVANPERIENGTQIYRSNR